MSYYKDKMHQVRFRPGLRPRPRWGAHSTPTDTLAGFKGRISKEGWRGTVVERRSLAGELSLSCARPAADG